MNEATLECADLFCGGGGSSEALAQAVEESGRKVNLVAVNHNPVAVETHRYNHPYAKHYCQDIRKVDPEEAVPSGRLDLMLAGLPCPHFSLARGGRPMDDRERSTPLEVKKWLKSLDVENVLMENVREFQTWGPLHKAGPRKGKPIKERMGEYYQRFMRDIEAMGYEAEARVLNAADYGAATTRKRLFIQARRGKPLEWPDATHSESEWRPAREIIDWTIPGTSIFSRKKPLSKKTIARIAVGIERFCGEWAEPFLVMLYGTGSARSIDRPMPTVTANGKGGGHIALCQFLLQQQSGGAPRDASRPAPTIAAKGAQSLIETCLVPFYGERKGQVPRTHSVEEPCPTVPASGAGKFGKVDFIVQVNHGGGTNGRLHDPDKALKTVTSKNGFGLASAFIVKYFGTGIAHTLDEPAPTVTTKDRIGLVELGGTSYSLDIRFRMLQPHELQAAMSFPDDYKFMGTRADQVRMIGNAWDIRIGKALIKKLIA